ncbi:hypothetical protein FXO37_02097 [Capsicum annuum]|nr:hypothetical protein FXO37_02097 [Capsicum annuum]
MSLRSIELLEMVDDAPPSVKRLKELHSTDQPELEAGNVADQKVNYTADEKAEAAGDAAVDGGVFTCIVGKVLYRTSLGADSYQSDEVVLSQAENNAYIVHLLLESPLDVGTSAGKGKLLNIENQVEDALAIARAFDLSVFSYPCRDLFSLKPTSQLDGLELDSPANIGSNNAADFELSIGTGNSKSFAEPFLLAFLLRARKLIHT